MKNNFLFCVIFFTMSTHAFGTNVSPRKSIDSLAQIVDDSRDLTSPRCSPRGIEDWDIFDYDDVLGHPRNPELDEESPLMEGKLTQTALLELHQQGSKKMILTSRGWRYLDEEPDHEMLDSFIEVGDQMIAKLHEGLDPSTNLLFEPFDKGPQVFKIKDTQTYMIVYKSIIFSGMHKGKALSVFMSQMIDKLKSETQEGEVLGLPQKISMTDDNPNYLDQIEEELADGLKGLDLRLYHFDSSERVS